MVFCFSTQAARTDKIVHLDGHYDLKFATGGRLPFSRYYCSISASDYPDLLSDVETNIVDTSFIFTKKSNVAKCFFDIFNAEIAPCCQKELKSFNFQF